MIDYIKYQIISPNFKRLLNNDYFDFIGDYNANTGEVFEDITKGYYRGLKFELFNPTFYYPKGRLTIRGSLHKYYNNGKHNYNDFNINSINKVVSDIQNKFDIKPEQCHLLSIEIGINITPSIPTVKIFDWCITHHKQPFKNIYIIDEGNYIQVKKQREIIKIYDKKTHYQNKGYNIPNEIMRFEIKYLKMQTFHLLGIFTLADLLHYGLDKFATRLLNKWNEILFYEPDFWDNTEYEYKYSSYKYWNKLKNDNRKYHLKKIAEIKNKPNSLQKKIAEIMDSKMKQLLQCNTL